MIINDSDEQFVKDRCPQLELHHAPGGRIKYMLALRRNDPQGPMFSGMTELEVWRKAADSLRCSQPQI